MMNKEKTTGVPNNVPLSRRIPPAPAAAFVGSFAAAYIAHLYAFTNIIPNADGLSRVVDAQQMTISGRWFLHFASIFNGFLQAPALIGFFSALFLSLAAALAVSLLRIRRVSLAILSGVLMAVFPPVAFTFLFQFTAAAYSFGILLAVLAVWLTARDRRLLLPAAALLACAVGTYQAYISVAASLSLICVLLFVLERENDCKAVLLYGVRHLVFLALGLLLYYGTLRVFLWAKDLRLLDYKGISATGSLGLLTQAASLLIPAYKDFFRFFFRPDAASYGTVFFVCLNAAFAVLGTVSFLRILRREGLVKRPGKLAMALLLCALLPLALNLAALMGSLRQVMRYSLVFTYLFALALADRSALPEEERPSTGRLTLRPLLAGALCLSVLTAAFSFYTDNLVYTASATAQRSTASFATRLVERVEAAPGYRSGMEVVIIGAFPGDRYALGVEAFDLEEVPADSVLTLNKHVYYYLNDWLNVPWPEPDEATLQAVSDSELFRAMPRYPDDGSIVIDGDRVIVKLADAYTPKRDYEIQYENRR